MKRTFAVLLAAVTASAGLATGSAAATQFQLVTEPADNYAAIYSLINSAKSTIDMTMYELADTTAQDDLANAAARGVKVRVILDTNLERKNNQSAYDYLSQHGVSVVWAPASYAATHQKTITVDGATSAIMSGNLTSRYYSTSRDFAVLDTDKADITAIENVFNADFANTAVTPADGDHLVWSPTDAQTKLIALINSATKTLSVENEEMGDTAVTDALAAAAKRGVTVQVTMTDNTKYHGDFNTLVAAGAAVHTYTQSASLYIHAKVIDVDAALPAHNSYVGSINFSDYSLNKNRELGFISTDAAVDSGLDGTLAKDFAGGTNYTG